MLNDLLADVSCFPGGHASTLRGYGITNVFQFLSLTMIHETHKGMCLALKISAEELDVLADLIRRQLPAANADLSPFMPGPHMLGLTLNDSQRARPLSGNIFKTSGLSSHIDHSPALGPVKNQGSRGTCVAFGTLAAFEHATGKPNSLSEQYLYYECKMHDGLSCEGTYIETAMERLAESGVCRDKYWEYNPQQIEGNLGQGPPPETAVSRAADNRVLSCEGMMQGNIAALKRELAAGFLIPCGIVVFSSMGNASTREDGIVVMPFEGERGLGGHCVCLTGYIDDDSAPGGGWFFFRNSWGAEWAPRNMCGPGYGLLPYSYMEQYGASAHVIRETTSVDWNSFKLLRKMVSPQPFIHGVMMGFAMLVLAAAILLSGQTGSAQPKKEASGNGRITAPEKNIPPAPQTGFTARKEKHESLPRSMEPDPSGLSVADRYEEDRAAYRRNRKSMETTRLILSELITTLFN
ncbi:C1 family peptidase [Maridesulfovibrio sp.]|uniref:C1 family peptidase n=1 Tax=Maridesulfovibrio sp. TaxID=2795000 RepID=UPI0039EF907F